MRVIFCGTAAFAVPSLHAVAEQHEIALVVTQQDRPGRARPQAPGVAGEASGRVSVGFRGLRSRARYARRSVVAETRGGCGRCDGSGGLR